MARMAPLVEEKTSDYTFDTYVFGEGYFSYHEHNLTLCQAYVTKDEHPSLYTLVFNVGKRQTVTIDQVQYDLEANTALPLMINQCFSFERPEDLLALQFNREFYCVVENDHEVGCVGFLFYGLSSTVFIPLTLAEQTAVNYLLSQLKKEISAAEEFKGQMLRVTLVGLIIYLTRSAKRLYNLEKEDESFYVIRQFNLLVEKHYRQHKLVKFYSDKLNKSPKTLSHICAHYAKKPPIKIIHQRVILESKRLIQYSDLSIKEIAFCLGYDDAAQFSKFFKNNTKKTPSDYRKAA
jgi:AraC family transcriptional regulator, transcriptional activator of pobA